MAQERPHTSLSRLWEYSKDPNSPGILFERRDHLTIRQDQVVTQIVEGLWSAGATANSVNEGRLLLIREMVPYPALFRYEIRRRFGVRLQQTDLDRTIGELASLIDQTPGRS
jgi:hypothetical protein